MSWLNELFGLPRLLFGSEHQGGWWHESLLETAIISRCGYPCRAGDATTGHPTPLSRGVSAPVRLVPEAPPGQRVGAGGGISPAQIRLAHVPRNLPGL